MTTTLLTAVFFVCLLGIQGQAKRGGQTTRQTTRESVNKAIGSQLICLKTVSAKETEALE